MINDSIQNAAHARYLYQITNILYILYNGALSIALISSEDFYVYEGMQLYNLQMISLQPKWEVSLDMPFSI